MRASRHAPRLLVVAFVLAFDMTASAHRYDELLQAARIGLEMDRLFVEMSLTPGIAVADAVIREIDADGDGVLSSPEQLAYAARVTARLTVRIDGSHALDLALADSNFPDPASMRTGNAAITFRLETALPPIGSGSHRLTFRNDHATASSVYLANALVPNDSDVTVTGQERDFDQRELNVNFSIRGGSLPVAGWGWIGFACALLLISFAARMQRATRAQPNRVL